MLYVIILSAALDLVPPSTPKGIIAFCNIAPALVVKVGWPYVLKGRIRYAKRVIGCCLLSVLGMNRASRLSPFPRYMLTQRQVVAFSDALSMRLLGIGLASFSSGINFACSSLTSTNPSFRLGGVDLSPAFHHLRSSDHRWTQRRVCVFLGCCRTLLI